MGFWETVGEAAKALVEANDPNNHYANGRTDGYNGNARTIYPVCGDGNNSLRRCADAYNRGYDDGVRERFMRRY